MDWLNRIWQRILDALRSIMDSVDQTTRQALDYILDHPRRFLRTLMATVIVVAPGLLVGPFLGFLGFGSAGVAAGTMASAWQSSIGNVVARSLFATLQSAGASGYGLGVVNGVVQAAGIAGIAGVVADSADDGNDGNDEKKH